ncbi:hypothetical protein FBU30_010506 [Linnemannia zychae]|nr:hypothetical protein FBU30_010506 [Linnemannia zychae]
MPENLDDASLDRHYRFPVYNNIVTVDDLWRFWTKGWDDGPSVRARSAKHGATWKMAVYDAKIAEWYAPRYRIVQEIQKLVHKKWLESKAVEGIEMLRKESSLEDLAKLLATLDDVPDAISNARTPNALATLLARAKPTHTNTVPGLTLPMRLIGGRCAPSLHPRLTTTVVEAMLEDGPPPTICDKEALYSISPHPHFPTFDEVQPESSTMECTKSIMIKAEKDAHLTGYIESIQPNAPATARKNKLTSTTRSNSPRILPSSSRSGSIGTSAPITEYFNNRRWERIAAKKEN